MEPIVDIQDVTVSYRDSVALNSISLKIYEGEMLAIAGPNGAGKTTLLTAINGLGKLLKGSVSIFGIQMERRTAAQLRKEIGYVPQIINPDSRMPMRVREVILLGRYGRIGLLKKPSRKDREVVEKVVELIGIKDLLQRPIGHLSGGEQKKVSIARALAQEPRILLLDEPISNLDINAQQSILNLIEQIHERENLTTVVVMHHLNLLPINCSRMVLLKETRVIYNGSVDQALNEKVLSNLYDCRVKVIKNNYEISIRAGREFN